MRNWAALCAMIFACVISFCGGVSATPLEDATRAYRQKYYAMSLQAYQQGDLATSMKIDQKFAEEGVAEAEAHYGCVFYNGEDPSIPKDYKKAMIWFRRAADQGDVWSQGRLGEMYYRGEGVPRDVVLSDMWFNLAAGSNVEKMTAPAPWSLSQVLAMDRDSLETKMSASMVLRARTLAAKCRESNYTACELE
jgi:TPR repeat protein